MKQQQILAIALVLLVQQVYFLTTVNSATADAIVKNDTPRTDVPATTNTVDPKTITTVAPIPTTTVAPIPTSSTLPPTPITSTTPPIPTTTTTTTTQPPSTTSSTAKPPQPPQPPRHFDLPSFIGGIVLTIGLIGIGFVAHKIYKSKFDRNYHTL